MDVEVAVPIAVAKRLVPAGIRVDDLAGIVSRGDVSEIEDVGLGSSVGAAVRASFGACLLRIVLAAGSWSERYVREGARDTGDDEGRREHRESYEPATIHLRTSPRR